MYTSTVVEPSSKGSITEFPGLYALVIVQKRFDLCSRWILIISRRVSLTVTLERGVLPSPQVTITFGKPFRNPIHILASLLISWKIIYSDQTWLQHWSAITPYHHVYE